MNAKLAAVLSVFALLCGGIATAQDAAAEAGVEVLTRGPVHEAFAAAVTYDPQPGLVVAARPPEPIEEIPPAQRPEGADVAWISGYWAWDEDRSDFLWVSGIWRKLPPGREWVPGYWSEVAEGWQWTSGYFKNSAAETVYLPAPPASVEEGPNIPAASADEIWIPGNWVWRGEGYAWSPGYWNAGRADWIWTPSCHRWTSRGYVWVEGYWDYEIPRRGILFAPVWFGAVSPGYRYCPDTVIATSVFVDHLFLRPRYCHYYFGDYYAPAYLNRGYYASCYYGYGRIGCDPIYNHHRWQNRHDRHWERQIRAQVGYRREHASARPARTRHLNDTRPPAGRIAERYDRVVAGRADRFRAVDRAERERVTSRVREVTPPRVVQNPPRREIVARPPVRLRQAPATAIRRPAVVPAPRTAVRAAPQVRRVEANPPRRVVAAPVRRFSAPPGRTQVIRRAPAQVSRPQPAPRMRSQSFQRPQASRPAVSGDRQRARR